MTSRYVFELYCPKCKGVTELTLSKDDVNNADVQLNCGECLIESVEVVRLTIEKVTVENVE